MSRRFAAALTAGALMLGSLHGIAKADPPPFTVDVEVLKDRLLAAQAQIHEGGQPGIERLLLSAEFLEWRRQNPTASGLEAADHLSARQDALIDARTPQDVALTEPEFLMREISVLMNDPSHVAAAAPHVRRLVEATLGKSVATFDTREDLVAGSLRGTEWMRARGVIEGDVWSAVRRQAMADAGFAYAWNAILGQPVSLSATASLAQMKADPVLHSYVDVDAILAHQASIADFLAEIERQFALVAAQLEHESAQARARLAQAAATCPVSPVPTCTPQQAAAAAATAKSEQKEIDAAAAASKLLGALAKIADLKEGEKIEKVASAWYSIITAINKFGSAISGSSWEAGVMEGAAFVMTGDILSAVMTLVGLLSDSGPSVDQQILDQVVKLRQEVRAMHLEMRKSFDIIEKQLNDVFLVMLNEFDKLGVAIAGNTVALISVQNQLAEQHLRLESVAATILTAIGDVELHDTRSDVNQYIGYADTYGQPIPSYGEYIVPENEFHYAATEIATHTAFVVPPSLANDPTVDPTSVIGTYGESAALSYLARLASARDPRVDDASQVFANPSIWNFAAQAYALLALQNPAFAQQVSEARSAQIALEGQRILDVASSFSRPTAQPDPTTGARTNPIFVGLTREYQNALGRLSTAIALVRTRDVLPRQEPIGTGGSGVSFQAVPKTYGLFGAPNQAIPDSTLPADFTALGLCSWAASNPQLSRPANVSFKLLAPELRFANYAFSPSMQATPRLPELSECYDAAFVNQREVVTANATDEYARLQISMRTRFRWAKTPSAPANADEQWVNARSATYTWPEMKISHECTSIHCSPSGDFTLSLAQAIVQKWPKDKAVFEQSAAISVDNAFLTAARTRMTAFLQGRQRALYQKVTTGVVNANTDLNLAAADMNDAVKQLQAYTRLGFPVALGSDDVLSSLLFGIRSLPFNTATEPQVSGTFGFAFTDYACTTAVAVGDPCSGGPFNPLTNQPFLDTTAPPFTVVCNVVPSGPGLPGDPVGDCLVAGGQQRLSSLLQRYAQYSAQLASGTYVERLPWIAGTLQDLPLVDTIVRTPPSN